MCRFRNSGDTAPHDSRAGTLIAFQLSDSLTGFHGSSRVEHKSRGERSTTARSTRTGHGRVRYFVNLLRDAMQSTSNTLRLCVLLVACGAVMFGIIELLRVVPFARFA